MNHDDRPANSDYAVEPFDRTTARHETAIARAEFTNHYSAAHVVDPEQVDMDNCTACQLDRFNYAGWLLLYIAARRPVPRAQFVAELEHARNENLAHYRKIMRAIATFGIDVRD